MKTVTYSMLSAALGLLVSLPLEAVTLRYGIVVGNNRGVDSDGSELPVLQHAEQEARELHGRLVELANFDGSPMRTRLLLSTTRAELQQAIAEVAATKQHDLERFEQASTLFAFFFTGHGLQERLLLNDGPLTATELGALIKEVDADFTIGVFDACFSGSLDPAVFSQKGIEKTPGLNLFKELPQEVLTAEGSIWFVSSGPTQASYEDKRVGGLFTHYFTEALKQAERDGPGITLDRIWAYARQRTVAHAAEQQRQQNPQQYVANLKLKGPLYFSFPMQRSARLVLEKGLQGSFLLTYAGGQLTEAIDKKRGERLSLAVFPGEAGLMMVQGGRILAKEELTLAPDSQLVLHNGRDLRADIPVGYGEETLWAKGGADDQLVASQVSGQANFLLGASYGFQLSPPGILLPQHRAQLVLRSDIGRWMTAFRLGYAGSAKQVESWGYQVHGGVAQFSFGYGWDIGPVRLNGCGALEAGAFSQRYDDGASRFTWTVQPQAQVGLLLPRVSTLLLEVMLVGGGLLAPGIGIESRYRFWGFGGVSVAGYYRFF